MNEKQETPSTDEAHEYRLRQAEELLGQFGYVQIPNRDRWCKPEDLPGQGGSDDDAKIQA